ncbi:MAG: alpha/beta hydrolase family protein [Propionibacteriaceae bacterium]
MESSGMVARADPNASRAEVMAHFREEVYGRAPTDGWDLSWELLHEHATATHLLRQQWALIISTELGTHRCVVLVDLPEGARSDKGAMGVPAFLGLNFRGNHACTADPDVFDIQRESPERCGPIHYQGLREDVTLPVSRGVEAHRWPAELVTSRGYVAITSCYLQCGPDSIDIFRHGIHRLFSTSTVDTRESHDWGSLSIWAWLLSRILDALHGGMVPAVDASRVAVVGHSRLGKAALWAAAQDSRFAAAISNTSGCMGAAASRSVGETPELLSRVRPQWFAPRFNETIRADEPVPVDQYQLLAAIAPRPVYVASASEDAPADPEGEFRSLCTAAPAWGVDPGAAIPQFPAPDTVRSWGDVPLGYHLRRGEHEMMPWDWIQYLSFADRWL